MFLWWSSTKIVQAIWICQKKGGGVYFPYISISSCQKPLDRFQYNLAEMFPWWPFTKIVQAVMVCQKTWPLEGRVWFSLYIYIETFNDLLVRNHWTYFKITLQECFLCNPLSRLFKQSWFIKKTWQLYIYIENFKNYLVRNHWTHFKYNLAEMFLWWPSTKIIQVIVIHQKTWLPGGGAYFPYLSI